MGTFDEGILLAKHVKPAFRHLIFRNKIMHKKLGSGQYIHGPWIHSNCNSLSEKDQLRAVPIPDILPASAGITEGFSMCGGDFVEVHSNPSKSEMSIELSLEDLKKVILHYGFTIERESTVETTYTKVVEHLIFLNKLEVSAHDPYGMSITLQISTLARGGQTTRKCDVGAAVAGYQLKRWINFGPLLYHFADTYGQDEMSIQLSLEDLKKVILHYGFTIERESPVETTYTKEVELVLDFSLSPNVVPNLR